MGLAEPAELELTSLELDGIMIRLVQDVPADTYTSVTLTFSDPEIKFCPDPPPTPCNDQSIRGKVNGTPVSPFFTFQLGPASDLFPDQSITVETSADTEFDDVAGVGNLSDGQEVRVKGLLFLQASGELLFLAEKVDASP